MSYEKYLQIKTFCGVLCTIGLYSVLYRENKFYRFFEHLFIGLAAGWMLVVIWSETLQTSWWEKMLGKPAEGLDPGTMGYWAYALLLPVGLMGYTVFSQKHSWMSRIPIGVILGFYSGQQVQVWWNRYGAQIDATLKPVIPTTWSPLFRPGTNGLDPEAVAKIAEQTYLSQAITNLIFVLTVVSVLSYFLFSFAQDNPAIKRATMLGRWLLMVGFGAIFGSTVMMRFTLLIDRMYFVWVEFFQRMVLHK